MRSGWARPLTSRGSSISVIGFMPTEKSGKRSPFRTGRLRERSLECANSFTALVLIPCVNRVAAAPVRRLGPAAPVTVILFLHHRYRSTGGEERAVGDLRWLVRERLGEDAELLERDSSAVPGRAAAAGLLAGGLHPEAVERAVRRTGARIVHAHNLHPTFGWRSLAAAQRAGARVVMHLHQYRMVCAIGVCFRDGAECTRCHGRNTLPGVLLNCRGSRAEALAYGAGLSLWQRRLAAHVDAFVVPSRFARARLQELGAPVDGAFVVPHVTRDFADRPPDRPAGHALVVSRLAPEKGVDLAIEACRIAGLELVVAGDGPERPRLEQLAAAGATEGPAGRVRFVGEIADPRWRSCAPRHRWRSSRRARRRRSGLPLPRRWPRVCPWRPPASAPCPSSFPASGWPRPGTHCRWPP